MVPVLLQSATDRIEHGVHLPSGMDVDQLAGRKTIRVHVRTIRAIAFSSVLLPLFS